MPYLKSGKYRVRTTSAATTGRWKNTSAYPDEWARPCVEWLCEYFNVRTLRVKIVKGYSGAGSGRAFLGSNDIFMRVNRRNYRANWSYTGISWDTSRLVHNSLEAFVFLAAHEIAHLSKEGREIYDNCLANRSMAGHNDWRKRMESRIQDMAQNALQEYRNAVRGRLLIAYDKSLRKARNKSMSAAVRQMRAKSPEARLSRLEERLAAWEAKKRRADAAIKKLRRRHSAIVSAQRRAALKVAANGL